MNLRSLLHLDEHLTDDNLASLFCNELPIWRRWIARQHLATCLQCRLRREELEGHRADEILRLLRRGRIVESASERAFDQLAQKLQLMRREAPAASRKTQRLPKFILPELPPMNVALVASVAFAFAAIVSFSIWWQYRTPSISSNALLVRAEHWDTHNLSVQNTVIYQSVRITMTKDRKKETISRALYRDVQGKRKPQAVKVNATEEHFRGELIDAGFDWNEPLSATDYQQWHDHQHVREDRVARAGSHFLRLTTTIPDGVVAEQSLTVRDNDFHPVERTVSLRDSGTIEIAEVDYKLLPWSHVDESVFEPLPSTSTTELARSPAVVVPFPHLPETLSEGQRDEAELAVRLVLNQLHADTGEQLDIQRELRSVVVSGVVETPQRKHELQAKLRLIPHVDAAIQTVAEVNVSSSPRDSIQSISVASMPDVPSLLTTLLVARGRSLPEVNALGQNLYSSALIISRESKEIADLRQRFGAEGTNSLVTAATLSELIYSHHERLDAALKRERSLLAEVTGEAAIYGSGPRPVRASDLTETANRNLQLVSELTQTNRPSTRSAEQILAEMSSTVNNLVVAVHDAYGQDRNAGTAKRNQ